MAKNYKPVYCCRSVEWGRITGGPKWLVLTSFRQETKKSLMENSGEFRNRLIGGFIVICIAMIAVSGAFLAQSYLGLPAAGALLV